MKRPHLGAFLAASIMTTTLSACTADEDASGNSDPGDPGPAETVTVTAAPEAEPLTLTTETSRADSCWPDAKLTDLAWFEVQWEAAVDLEEFSFELTGAEGVTQVGAAETVPPVNFGGRINYGGTIRWEGHKKYLARGPFISGTQIDSTDFWSPIEGETGLLIFHLRLDPEVLASPTGGGFDGVRGTYRTVDGQSGEVEVATKQILRIGNCQ